MTIKPYHYNLIKAVQSAVLGSKWHNDDFSAYFYVIAHGDVYEIWFAELSNIVITPLYNGHSKPTGALVTIMSGGGSGVNVSTHCVEEFSNFGVSSCIDWLLANL